jgi:hypothetical protein
MAVATPRSETAAGRRSALAAGRALPPASPGAAPGYPITDASHWDKARQAVGRVKSPARRQQLSRLLRKTAPMVGRAQALNESWAAAGGSDHSNTGQIRQMLFAGSGSRQLECPNCGYRSDDADFKVAGGSADTDDPSMPEALRTPVGNVSSTAGGMRPEQIGVAAGRASGSLSNPGRGGIMLAGNGGRARGYRPAVTTAADIVVSRGPNGTAVIRHRQGGSPIGEIARTENGWTAVRDGGQLQPHTHQRAALAELIGVHNRDSSSPYHRAAEPLQPPPVQTPLMQQFGIPAVRALATPSNGDDDGPRATTSGSSDGSPAGLTPKGMAIYKKLMAKGFPAARALTFARRAQSFGGSKAG